MGKIQTSNSTMKPQEIIDILNRLSWAEALYCIQNSKLKVSFSTSLGQEDQILTHMIAQAKSPARIFTLDTGRLFPETYDLIQLTQSKYNIDIEVIFPESKAVENLVKENGINGFLDSVENRKRCCSVRKIDPLKRALKNQDIWITGLRASQSENRIDMPKAQWDDHFNMIKYNPLIDWSLDQVLEYIEDNNIPYNHLHDKGFVSIGCAPCTRAIQPGEDLRAGRWWWEMSKKECGLHQ